MSFKLNKPSLLGSPKVGYNSIDGFRPGSDDEHNHINIIQDTNVVDMTGVPYDIQGIDNLGYSKTMKAYSGVHNFHPKATKVKEVKIKKVK